MPEITVTIADRPYRMACGEGEEQHLLGLAEDFDRRIAALRQHFGEVGDSRLLIMAALTIADDLADAKRRVEAGEQRIAELEHAHREAAVHASQAETQTAARIDMAAAAVERMVEMLSRPPRAS